MIIRQTENTITEMVIIKSGKEEHIQKEIECYKRMKDYVAQHEVIGDKIKIDYIESQPVKNISEFIKHYEKVLAELDRAQIKHGDLTDANLIVHNNKPYIVDWAESVIDGNGKVKRPEGDDYWLMRTMMKKIFGAENIRKADMWWYIYKALDNWKVKVVDYGCGYGGVIRRASIMGADAIGIDKNFEILETISDKLVYKICADVNEIVVPGDVAFCHSVLPYINSDKMLDKLKTNYEISFIEWQYKNDGPGTLTKSEVENELRKRWADVEVIGYTIVEGRNTTRDIWRCRDGR